MTEKIRPILIIVLAIILTVSFTVMAQEEEKEDLYEDKEFRNPFVEYQEPEPQKEKDDAETEEEPAITFAKVREELPFNLSGIISRSDDERIALLNTGEGTELIRGYYEVDNYELIAIQADSVIVRNRGFRLRLKIGGEIDEI